MVKHEGGKVSEIYLIVMALFATRFFGIFVGMQARKLVESYDDFFDFTHTLIWHLRLLPEAIVFLILAVVLTKRFVKSYLFKDPQYTRKNGNRKTDK